MLAAAFAAVARLLEHGRPSLGGLVHELGVPPGHLRRELRRRGLTYSGFVDAAQRELALRLMRRGPFGPGQLAFILGFADAAAFQRARRRWARAK